MSLNDLELIEDKPHKGIVDRKHVLITHLTSLNALDACEAFDGKQMYQLIHKLYVLVSSQLTNDELRLFHEQKCELMFIKLLKYFAQISNELHYKAENGDQINVDAYVDDSDDLNQRRVFIFSSLMQIINQLFFKLVIFNLEFIRQDGLTGFFDLVRNKNFLQKLSENDLKTLSSIVNSMNLLSRYSDYSDEIKQIWIDSKITAVFMDVALHFKIFKIVRFVYLILANISDLDAVQSLPDINQVIKSLVSDMNSFCNYFKETPYISRIKIEKLDYKKEIKEYEVSFLNGKSLIGILYSLNKLATDPILKYKIWEATYAKTSLKYIILNGNEIEKLYALRLLENLCPIDSVVEFCMFDNALHNMLVCLSKNRHCKVEELRLVSRRIIELTRKHDIHLEGFIIHFAVVFGYFMEKFVFIIDKGF